MSICELDVEPQKVAVERTGEDLITHDSTRLSSRAWLCAARYGAGAWVLGRVWACERRELAVAACEGRPAAGFGSVGGPGRSARRWSARKDGESEPNSEPRHPEGGGEGWGGELGVLVHDQLRSPALSESDEVLQHRGRGDSGEQRRVGEVALTQGRSGGGEERLGACDLFGDVQARDLEREPLSGQPSSSWSIRCEADVIATVTQRPGNREQGIQVAIRAPLARAQDPHGLCPGPRVDIGSREGNEAPQLRAVGVAG